ncbi:ABC transporter permease [Xylanimonas protaetiae]|uniref:ABC transporter permease n=1 Tax=Xylanimonas protaetiae TaxID=2509457 RepID=A0A4P6F4L2_9MICO|nr:ABC transporter permease [Xylanimonas protaetiae]QAY70524.1 ABC transporter permease [Xylanimonas protaetiae]
MKALDVLKRANANAFRSKLRTTLTALAIVIGAFALTLTNALGAGVNSFMADTVATIGVDNVLTVTPLDEDAPAGDGPAVFDPDRATMSGGPMAGALGPTLALTAADLDTIAATPGVLDVSPMRMVALDFVQADGSQPYQVSLGMALPGMHVELAAGSNVDLTAPEPQVILPTSYVTPLGFATPADAVGATVDLGLTDATGTIVTQPVTVVGIAEPGLLGSAGAIPNPALTDALFDLSRVGRDPGAPVLHMAAFVTYDPDAGEEATADLQAALAAEGFDSMTVDDQLGMFTSVIDTVVFVLSSFAVIALVAASIGIINTLFMAVQERTREVGLMKAMGLSSAKVFALFSVEATVIGLLGSAVGVLVAMVTGRIVSDALAGGILADLPGLNLFVFEPLTVLAVVAGVMAVAFLAGTLPALRAAKADPISSLRYE